MINTYILLACISVVISKNKNGIFSNIGLLLISYKASCNQIKWSLESATPRKNDKIITIGKSPDAVEQWQMKQMISAIATKKF